VHLSDCRRIRVTDRALVADCAHYTRPVYLHSSPPPGTAESQPTKGAGRPRLAGTAALGLQRPHQLHGKQKQMRGLKHHGMRPKRLQAAGLPLHI
jgi:hypothetical protein